MQAPDHGCIHGTAFGIPSHLVNWFCLLGLSWSFLQNTLPGVPLQKGRQIRMAWGEELMPYLPFNYKLVTKQQIAR